MHGEPGDTRFEDFFLFEYPRLVAALRLVTGDDDRARDSVDEACARAWERLNRRNEIDELGAWIRVVAFNVARDRHRRRGSERRARERLERRPAGASSDLSAQVAAAVDVQVALTGLPSQQREIVVRFYFLDHSVDTIATELRIPAGTVKAALHRARGALAAVLDDRPHREGEIRHV